MAGGKYTIQANGKIVGHGDGHITGGTGLYRGLTGKARAHRRASALSGWGALPPASASG